jgi:hypothetical protein
MRMKEEEWVSVWRPEGCKGLTNVDYWYLPSMWVISGSFQIIRKSPSVYSGTPPCKTNFRSCDSTAPSSWQMYLLLVPLGRPSTKRNVSPLSFSVRHMCAGPKHLDCVYFAYLIFFVSSEIQLTFWELNLFWRWHWLAECEIQIILTCSWFLGLPFTSYTRIRVSKENPAVWHYLRDLASRNLFSYL